MLAEINAAETAINTARAKLGLALMDASKDARQIEITRRLLAAVKFAEGMQYVMVEVSRAVHEYEAMRRDETRPSAKE